MPVFILILILALFALSNTSFAQNIYTDGDEVSVELPGVSINTGKKGASVKVPGVEVETNATTSSSKIQTQYTNTPQKPLQKSNLSKTLDLNTESSFNFRNGDFVNMSFAHKNLEKADFMNANFNQVSFESSNLRNAVFKNADFENCNLRGADLSGANFTNANFENCDLRGAIVIGASFRNVDFINTKVFGVDFSNADLTNADFSSADFTTSYTVGAEAITKQLTRKVETHSSSSSNKSMGKNYHDKPNVSLAIQFAFDSDKLEGDGWQQLAELSKALKAKALVNTHILIEGHTDSVGSDEYNIDLSYRRAATIMRTLSNHYGIDASRLQIKGYGETRPVQSNDTEFGRAQNRRVTLVNMSS